VAVVSCKFKIAGRGQYQPAEIIIIVQRTVLEVVIGLALGVGPDKEGEEKGERREEKGERGEGGPFHW